MACYHSDSSSTAKVHHTKVQSELSKAVHGYLPSTQGKFSDVYPWVKVNVGNRKAVYPWVKVKVGKGVISG